MSPVAPRRGSLARHQGCQYGACATDAAFHGANVASRDSGGFLVAQSGGSDEKQRLPVNPSRAAPDPHANPPRHPIPLDPVELSIDDARLAVDILLDPFRLPALAVEVIAQNRNEPRVEGLSPLQTCRYARLLSPQRLLNELLRTISVSTQRDCRKSAKSRKRNFNDRVFHWCIERHGVTLKVYAANGSRGPLARLVSDWLLFSNRTVATPVARPMWVRRSLIGATRSLASGWPELRRPRALPALRRDRMGGAAASYSPAEFAWTSDASFVYTSDIG